MASTSSFLEIAGARKAFGSQSVLGGVDLVMPRGEFVSLLGPSGCGKTTLLRIVAGLLGADGGVIRLDGIDITPYPPHKRDVGVVFQNYALFPHLTVAENVAFGLAARGRPRSETEAIVGRFLDLVHMTEFASKSVRQLSGGQQQRVAVARALAVQPKLLLLDEPFSALDRKLRETMQIELKRLLRELAITAVFVTHDQDEALVMSDRIAVMNQGRIEQIANPPEVYRRPATPFVLDFVGLSSRMSGRIASLASGQAVIDTEFGQVRANVELPAGTHVDVGVRPERFKLAEPDRDLTRFNRMMAIFRDLSFQGSKAMLHFDCKGDDRLMVETADASTGSLAPGSSVALWWAIEDTLVFAKQGERAP